jgi:hypothetical protein
MFLALNIYTSTNPRLVLMIHLILLPHHPSLSKPPMKVRLLLLLPPAIPWWLVIKVIELRLSLVFRMMMTRIRTATKA